MYLLGIAEGTVGIAGRPLLLGLNLAAGILATGIGARPGARGDPGQRDGDNGRQKDAIHAH